MKKRGVEGVYSTPPLLPAGGEVELQHDLGWNRMAVELSRLELPAARGIHRGLAQYRVLVGFHHSFRLSHASTPFLDFYRWGFPTAPIQVHLSIDVVNGICRQIQDYGNFPGMLLRTHQPSGGI